jgi:hypothetical protein
VQYQDSNPNLVIPTALKNINEYGKIDDVYAVKMQDQTEIANRIARAEYVSFKKHNENKLRSYGKYKVYDGVERDLEYVKFFDIMDCKIMRIIFLAFGGYDNKDGDLDIFNMDGLEMIQGLGNILKFIIISFPYGIIAALLMTTIAASLFLVLFKTLQSYTIGIFGLVSYAYLSPIFVLLRLFKTTEGAFKKVLDNMTGYLVLPNISFLSVGIYMAIIEVAFFGDPNMYEQLFDLDGSILANCYASSPDSAPIVCITKKIIDNFDFGKIWALILISVGMAAAVGAITGGVGFGLGAGLIGFGGSNILLNTNIL